MDLKLPNPADHNFVYRTFKLVNSDLRKTVILNSKMIFYAFISII
jgi:hypothetical protein